MKATITAMILIVGAALFTAPYRSSAQTASDTLVVSAMPPGNINNMIMGDTTATGQRNDPNRVYVLQQTGSSDSTYFFTAPIYTNYNLTIIGKTNPVTGHPPVIEPFINPDNSTPGSFCIPRSGNVTFKNLYFLGTRTDGISLTGNVVSTLGDSITVRVDHCVFDNFGTTGAVVFYFGGSYSNFFATNCEYRNLISDTWRQPDNLWNNGGIPEDTVEYVNNTFFCTTRSVIGTGGYTKYFSFDHNTMFLDLEGVVLAPQLTNAVIKNNIFYGCEAHGQDSTLIRTLVFNNGMGPSIITLDTLTTLKASPFNFTEADRNVVVENNAYFWPKALYDYWTAVSDTAHDPGLITAPVWMNKLTTSMFADHTRWPGFVESNNDSVDPEFSPSLVTPGLDSLVKYVDTLWVTGSGQGYRWSQFPTDPLNIFASVPQNWASSQGYPVPENLAYSSATLQSAGTNKFALGDLNWFPAQLKLWEEGQVNAVRSTEPQVPTKFDLSQNYPNPFNPSTDIKFSLTQSGVMSLKIYNVLGQVVDVVAQGYRPAGTYLYNVNMDRFASGVYFYTLQQGSNVMTRKMLLLK